MEPVVRYTTSEVIRPGPYHRLLNGIEWVTGTPCTNLVGVPQSLCSKTVTNSTAGYLWLFALSAFGIIVGFLGLAVFVTTVYGAWYGVKSAGQAYKEVMGKIMLLEAKCGKLEEALAKETTARLAAECALQEKLKEEVKARTQADTNLTTKLDKERVDRQAAAVTLEASVTKKINDESADRKADDHALRHDLRKEERIRQKEVMDLSHKFLEDNRKEGEIRAKGFADTMKMIMDETSLRTVKMDSVSSRVNEISIKLTNEKVEREAQDASLARKIDGLRAIKDPRHSC
ncbi:hypothetical protein TWF173_007141 [Orbilia oligospora]|uniref:Uncharacterized protein n=1 Tax=Orbilia oligospora TaxID=2813651 RepID=A0A7C8RCK2_ORBOL|nr:hypothetical protein TWF970_011526 [Orbilia oligospora]KAF3312531.1 hypothetical protein TWF173_007141 [Orbilia oligospora]